MLDFNREKLLNYVKNSNFDCDFPDYIWKKREVAQILLGTFANDIIYYSEKT